VYEDLAKEIIALSRINTNAASIAPGEMLTIDVFPGTLGNLGSVALAQASSVLAVRVGYALYRGHDQHDADHTVTSSSLRVPPKPDGDDEMEWGDFLHVAFKLPSPSITIGGATSDESEAGKYDLVVTITVSAAGSKIGEREITVPVDVPPISLPALAVLSSGARFKPRSGGYGNAFVLLTPTGGGIDAMEQVLSLYNTAAELLEAAEALVDLIAAAIAPIRLLTKILTGAPEVALVVGGASDFDDIPAATARIFGWNFDDENESLLLIAPTSVGLRLYWDSDYDWDDGTRLFKPVDFSYLLNPKDDDRAVFARDQLKAIRDELLGESPDDPLPTLPSLTTLSNWGLVCISDWRGPVPEQLFETYLKFHDGDPILHNVQSAHWESITPYKSTTWS
jgi:hypothetical protein